jgi:hypothetical protein
MTYKMAVSLQIHKMSSNVYMNIPDTILDIIRHPVF